MIRLSYCLEPFRDAMSRPVALVTGGGQGIEQLHAQDWLKTDMMFF